MAADTTLRYGKPPRTSNRSERYVIESLMAQGYKVIKRGWPDLIAWKDNECRFIEVKPLTTKHGRRSGAKMKPQQLMVAKLLARFGIHVELIRGV